MYGAPPRCIEVTYSVADSPTVQRLFTPSPSLDTDLRLIKHRPWFALYPPDEFVSGVKRPLALCGTSPLFRVSRLSKPKKRADERIRTADLLITSETIRVAGVCTGMQILHI